ncbi:hypothetical protein F4859DRAFT_476053 [Xylaria cf. heliscus]|nr:hypothetical protein F4859DRAFT_476053 [Xylaria cf. heliscus]
MGFTTVWPLEKTLTTYAPLPDRTVITIDTSKDGHHTVWTFTKTFTHLPSDALISILQIQNTSSSAVTQDTSTSTARVSDTNLGPTATEESKTARRNQKWVAGPVVGGVAGIAILLLVTWALIRAKRNKDRKRKGHELHGESALKSELETIEQPQELDGREQRKQPIELPSTNSA